VDLVLFILVSVAVVIPMYRLLPQFGLNPLWSLISFVPLGLIVLLWVMAFRQSRIEVQ